MFSPCDSWHGPRRPSLMFFHACSASEAHTHAMRCLEPCTHAHAGTERATAVRRLACLNTCTRVREVKSLRVSLSFFCAPRAACLRGGGGAVPRGFSTRADRPRESPATCGRPDACVCFRPDPTGPRAFSVRLRGSVRSVLGFSTLLVSGLRVRRSHSAPRSALAPLTTSRPATVHLAGPWASPLTMRVCVSPLSSRLKFLVWPV